MEEDRYTRITLRLPRDLHTRLDEVADKTSKSLNAEIVGRLETSFLQAGDLDALRDKLAAAEKLARQNELNGIRDRMKSMQYLMTLSTIVDRLPAQFFDHDPTLAELVVDIRGKGSELVMSSLQQAAVDLARAKETLDEGVASGRIEVLPQAEFDAKRAARKKKG